MNILAVVNLGDYFEPVKGGRFSTIGGAISLIYAVIIAFSGVIVLFLLLFGGIQYITSGGDQKKTESARSILTSAIIGFVLIVAAVLLFPILQNFFGLPKIF